MAAFDPRRFLRSYSQIYFRDLFIRHFSYSSLSPQVREGVRRALFEGREPRCKQHPKVNVLASFPFSLPDVIRLLRSVNNDAIERLLKVLLSDSVTGRSKAGFVQQRIGGNMLWFVHCCSVIGFCSSTSYACIIFSFYFLFVFVFLSGSLLQGGSAPTTH